MKMQDSKPQTIPRILRSCSWYLSEWSGAEWWFGLCRRGEESLSVLCVLDVMLLAKKAHDAVCNIQLIKWPRCRRSYCCVRNTARYDRCYLNLCEKVTGPNETSRLDIDKTLWGDIGSLNTSVTRPTIWIHHKIGGFRVYKTNFDTASYAFTLPMTASGAYRGITYYAMTDSDVSQN